MKISGGEHILNFYFFVKLCNTYKNWNNPQFLKVIAKHIDNNTLYDISNNSPIERLNLKLCKFLLGVHRKSTNAAVRGELGRYPLLISIINNAKNYHERILSLENDSLVKLSCNDQVISGNDASWSCLMNKMLQTFNGTLSLKSNLEKIYGECWSSEIESVLSQGKLRVLFFYMIPSCFYSVLSYSTIPGVLQI